MSGLVWGGVALTLAGLVGIIWSAIKVARARKAGLDDTALRDRMQSILPINIAALFMSMLGLGMVVVGLVLA
ncbi:MAG: hypothetical protein CSA72_13340 [Rhodobacterales bacterium]|nr:MAG: hypothetical protein CSA72_13340 [Rhodobacterales bacterium]